jgi:hypothetical protein
METSSHLRLTALPVVLASLFALSGCKKGAEGVDGGTPSPSASTPAAKPGPSAAAAVARKPGEMPFDFTSGATTAKAGDSILAPSGNWIDEAFVKGGDKQTFIFYARTMAEPGELESKIKTSFTETAMVPNGFIIAIKPGQKAKPGDIVLTSWQSGSGMMRSIIVAGGTEEEPKALHLDMDLEGATGSAKKEDTLKKNTFHKVGSTLEPGVTVAAKDGGAFKRAIVTSIAGDKVLTIGFAGHMKVYKKSDCTVVPPSGSFTAGSEVAAPKFGKYTKAKVDHVDAKIGRVFVKFPNDAAPSGIGLQDVSPVLAGM